MALDLLLTLVLKFCLGAADHKRARWPEKPKDGFELKGREMGLHCYLFLG
jgi:hypothetical protein